MQGADRMNSRVFDGVSADGSAMAQGANRLADAGRLAGSGWRALRGGVFDSLGRLAAGLGAAAPAGVAAVRAGTRPRRAARPWRRGPALLALAMAALLWAAPEARAELLIGNLNIGTATTSGQSLASTVDIAQGFTTGGNTAGYTLESIEMFFDGSISSTDIGDLTATVREAGNDGDPGTTVATLSNPASITGVPLAGDLDADDAAVFTAPDGTTLAAGTDYFVVLDFDQSRTLWGTQDNGENPGGAVGWSIADDSTALDGSEWVSANASYYIRVNGAAKTALPVLSVSADSATVGEGAGDNIRFTVTRTGSTDAELGFNVSTSGTATSNVDYSAFDSSSTTTDYVIDAGNASDSFGAFLVADSLVEGPETVILTIDALDTYTVHATAGSATVTIIDDDGTMPPAAELLIGNLLVGTATSSAQQLTSTVDIAQGFTTGGNTAGYTLESIEMFFHASISSTDIGDLTATVREADGDGNPGTTVAALSNPASITGESDEANLDADDAAVFTAPDGTTLAAGTVYFVVLDFDQSRQVWGATDNGESPGGAVGWSIADDSTTSSGVGWLSAGNSYYIRVSGAAKTASTADATLSALTLMEGTDAVTLTPTFASDTIAYRAWVENDVSSVTLTATKNRSEATLAITGDNDTATPNTATLALAEGANTLTVTVTAEDDNTTKTYTITAVREASAPEADPTARMTAKLTVEQGGTADAYGYQRVGSTFGALTDNDFEFDGATYTITNLFYNGPNGEAFLGLDSIILCLSSLPGQDIFYKWTLSVGSDDYPLEGEAVIGSSNCLALSTSTPWAHGDVQTIKIFGNQDATGAPGISGTAQVGRTLTASTDGIADLDGKAKADASETGFAYTYQWIRVDADGTSNAADITGATSATYTPVAADVGKKVMTKVNFKDDAGYAEELTSAAYPASETILAAAACAPTLTGDQRQIWTGALTVGSFTASGITFYGYSTATDPDTGALTPAAITVGMNSYTASLVTVAGSGSIEGRLSLTLSANLTNAQVNALVLHVCDTPFPLSDFAPGGTGIYNLDGSGLDWSSQNSLSLYLSIDDTVPVLESATVDGDTLVLTYDEDLKEAATPADAFAVKRGIAGAVAPTAVAVDGKTLTLTLSKPATPGQPVTLSYTVPGSQVLQIQDVSGNAAAALTDQVVTNGTSTGTTSIASLEITSTPTAATGTYGVGEKIQFTVTFHAPVEVSTGRPHFEFSLDGDNTDAAYEGGSGTTALTFSYTVLAADTDSNGIWVGDQSRTIMLDSGEYIRTVTGQTDADLDHAGPGTQSEHKVNGSLTPPNTAPTAADGAVTTAENTAYTFDAGDFNFADTDAGDTLEKVKIVTLPAAGTLALSGTTVMVNQEVTKAAIDADNLTFTPVTDAEGSPYTTFTFKVNDGDDDSAAAYTMTVNVTDNAAPIFADATLTRELTENTAADVAVGAVIPAATDADVGDTLTYSMEGTDASSFNFDVDSRQITTKTGVTYDYEMKTSYAVTIKVEDSVGASDTVDVTINVKNLPGFSIEPEQERILLSDGRVRFGLTVDTRPSAAETRVNFIVTQDEEWLATEHLQGTMFHVSEEAVNISGPSSFKRDAPVQGGSLTVTLQPGVGYELGSTKTATVEIVAADPLITVRAEQADYSVAENFGTLTVTLIAETVVGAPQPLADTAVIAWAATADSATGGGSDFRDAGAAALSFGADLFTEVGGRWVLSKDVEVTLVNDSVWELDEEFHIALSRYVEIPMQPTYTHPLVKRANADGTLCEDNDAGDNCGATVTILSNDNAAPGFSGSTTRELTENSPADTDVGLPVAATDANTGAGDALTYTLEGDDAASFAIDAATGQITTISGVDYDFEADPLYSVTVTATDRQGASATVAITINLIDVAVEVDVCVAPDLAGREQVWTAEMTVGSIVLGVFTERGYFGGAGNTYGALSEDEFQIGTTSYLVPELSLRTGLSLQTLTFHVGSLFPLNAALPDRGIVLHICNESFGLADANNDQGTYTWQNARLDWSSVETRNVYLSLELPVPELQPGSSEIDGDSLVLTFDEDLDESSIPPGNNFEVLVTPQGGTATRRGVRGVRVRGRAVTLELESAVMPGDEVSVNYLGPILDSDPALKGANGARVPPFGDFRQLRNITVDTVAPMLLSQTISAASLTLVYDEALDETSKPAPDAYDVQVTSPGGTAERRDVDTVQISGDTVTLTLASRVRPNQTVTLQYTVPASNPVQDPAGNKALAIGTALEVTNKTSGNRAPSFDGVSWNPPPSFHITRQVPENSGGGVAVGEPIHATDPDGDRLSWKITRFQRTITSPSDSVNTGDNVISTEWVEWGASAYFDIDANTGQIRTKSGVDYDYEKRRSYFVEVEVSDGFGALARTDVLIELTDEGEPEDSPLLAPEGLTLRKLGPSAVALSWQSPASSAAIDKHQFRLGRHPTSVDGVLGGIGPQSPANRVFRDDGWMDFPADAAGPLGHVLRGAVGGQPLIHVWELKAQVRSVTAEGEVSQPSNVAFMPDTAPTMVRVGVVSDPGSDDVYESGETIAVELELDEPVRFSRGPPAAEPSDPRAHARGALCGALAPLPGGRGRLGRERGHDSALRV